jgi:hypothetical protein
LEPAKIGTEDSQKALESRPAHVDSTVLQARQIRVVRVGAFGKSVLR